MKLDVGDELRLGRGPRLPLSVTHVDGDRIVVRGPRGVVAKGRWWGRSGTLDNGVPVRFVRSAPKVESGTVWRHTSGRLYRVMHVTNTAHDSPAHPPDVVYHTLHKPERVWSRPLSDWFRSFTREYKET